MNIQLINIGKRFGSNKAGWIFRDINQNFELGSAYAITGRNGAGKSTLLKIISGGLTPTLGVVQYINPDGKAIFWSDTASLVNYAAPYIELLEYLTLKEHVQFHYKFKNYVAGMNQQKFIQAIDMTEHQNKLVKDFSSGMKQRLKLAFAIFTENPIVLLDEPTSNLDDHWSNWYLAEVQKIKDTRLLVIASNQPNEYDFCDEVMGVGKT